MNFENNIIGFIGGGNMAAGIIGGLVSSGHPAANIIVSSPNPQSIQDTFKVITTKDNHIAAQKADILVLSVKPQLIKPICLEVQPYINKASVIISIAAGISCDSLTQWLGQGLALIRCMPNTPSLIQMGAAGAFANAYVNEQQKEFAQKLLHSVGMVHWVDNEKLIDAITAVSGSGPAYIFLMIEAMTKAGVELGLTEKVACELAAQTVIGAGHLTQQSNDSPTELRHKVTSPNGTTEQAILSLQKNNFEKIIAKAMLACSNRAEAIGVELSS